MNPASELILDLLPTEMVMSKGTKDCQVLGQYNVGDYSFR